MRRDLLAAVSAVALSSGFAFAAQAAAPVAPPVFTWTGCYVGVQAGIDFGHTDWGNVPLPFAAPFPNPGYAATSVGIGTSGGIYGGQVGCNYQFQNFVIGGVGEVWGSSLSGSTRSTILGGEGFKAQSDIAGDIAIRGGFAFDRTLIYAKIGAAWAHYKFTETYSSFIGLTDTGSGQYSGVLLGVGAEFAIDAHWSIGAEYDYINYPAKNVPLHTQNGDYDYTAHIGNIENIIKAAVNFRF
jgi:outer membrane immunogenic protein